MNTYLQQIRSAHYNRIRLFLVWFTFLVSTFSFSQSPCTLSNFNGAYVLNANDYPYFSPGSGVTVSVTNVGVPTLNNFTYNCGGQPFATVSPAFWINAAAPTQSLTFNFSQPVCTFSIIVNGTNLNEIFYFAAATGTISLSDFCTAGFTAINGGTALQCTQSAATGTLITVNNPVGSTSYTLTHSGTGSGSRYALVDCFVVCSVQQADFTAANFCEGDATAFTPTFSSAPSSVTWNFGDPLSGANNTSTATNPTHVFTGPGTYNVTMTAVIGGVPTTVTNPVTIDPAPTVNNVTDQIVCAGNPVNAINFTGSIAGTTYSWTNSNPAIGLAASGTGNIAGYNAPSVTNTEVGTITVTPTANGCTGPAETFTITVNPVPTVDAITDQTICSGGVTSWVNFTGNNAGTTYNWTNNNTSIGLAASGSGNIAPFTTINASGTTEIANIVVTPSLGSCIGATQAFNITVLPAPTVDPIADQTLCANLWTTAVNFTGNAMGTTYNWSNNNTSIGLAASGSGNIASFAALNTSASAQVATIVVTPMVGTCTGANETFTITVEPVPTVDPIIDQEWCVGESTTAINFTGSTVGANYSWTNSQPGIGLAGSGTGNIASFVTANNTGAPIIANITVTPDANGCNGPQGNFTITVNPLPIIDAGLDQTVCEGTTITLNGSGGVSYSWNNGVTDGIGFVQTPGTVTYTVIGTDVRGCVNTDQVDVIVNANPIVAAGTDQTVCYGTSVTLNGSGANSYAWSNGVQDGVAFTPGVGTLTYTVVGTDLNGCIGSDDVDVTVNPLPTVYAGADFLVCEGTSITLSGSGALTYVWNNGVTDGVSFVQSPGFVTYTVTGTDANGCTNSDNINVTVEGLPVVSFYASELSGCAPFETTLINTTPGNMSSCVWTLSSGASYSGCAPLPITIEQGGLYDLTLTTTSNNGCTNTATYTDYIYVENVPIAAFYPSSYELSILDPEVEFYNYSTGAVNYLWYFGDGGTSNEENPSYQYQSDVETSYEVMLIAISPIGCRDTAYHQIGIVEELIFFIPNTFTPDGDQFNQIFQPIFTSGHDPYDFNFYIFNRWGEIIWESHDPEVGWDGTYGGHGLVQFGQYVWKADFKLRKNDERVQFTGHVNVIR